MPIRALNVAATFDYIHPSDEFAKEPDKATVFKLRALDAYQKAEVQNVMTTLDFTHFDPENPTQTVGQKINPFLGAITMVKYSLAGWERFKDENGNDIEFKTKGSSLSNRMYKIVSDDLLARIPEDVLMDMSNKIKTLGELSQEELKN